MVNTGDTFVPAATVTEDGTVTPGLPLDRFTIASAGATPFMLTLLAVVEWPPTTDDGDSVTEAGVNGMTDKLLLTVAPL